ncbi:MAG: DNA gyrase C-terminal beta-propeller domain-containing protein [Gammaproteobacteria bacterium]
MLKRIREFSEILADPDKLIAVIRAELTEIRDNYADKRRTEIVQVHSSLEMEDDSAGRCRGHASHGGYARAQSISDYQVQRRGGRGRSATRSGRRFHRQALCRQYTDTLLCFTSTGKVYWLKVYEVPRKPATGPRSSDGQPPATGA